jgi:hypothetical protein
VAPPGQGGTAEYERLSFLAVTSMKPTARERRIKVRTEKHPSITGGKSKQKLTMTPSKELAKGPLQEAKGLF